MKINPTKAKNAAYPTLASVSAGAVLLVGSACQPTQATGGKMPVKIAENITHTPPKKESAQPHNKTAFKQAPQMEIGRARIDSATGNIISPSDNNEVPHILGGSIAPPHSQQSKSLQNL